MALETGEREALNPSTCVLQSTRWGSLTAFLSAAATALHNQEGCPNNEPKGCTACKRFVREARDRAAGVRSGSSGRLGALLMQGLDWAFAPAATVVISFAGHCHVQRLIDPSAPHPAFLVARYTAALVASAAIVVLGVWVLGGVMRCAGVAVCHVADALQATMAEEWEEECAPMLPEGWILPSGFALLGAYISVQVAWLCGATLRHVALHWDTVAWKALALWFAVCLAYTAFVYAARLLLTVLVVLAAPEIECSGSVREAGLC